MQIVHLMIVELANHSLQNLGKGVDFDKKTDW